MIENGFCQSLDKNQYNFMFLILFGHAFPPFFPHSIFQDIHPGEALREGQGGPQGRLRAHDVLGAGHEKRLRHPWGRHDDQKNIWFVTMVNLP